MAGNEQIVFKKVGVSERKLLFREITNDREQLSIRGDDDEMFNLIAIQNDDDVTLLCHHTDNSKMQERTQKVIVNFPFKAERYFFQTELTFKLGWAILRIDVDLFQLQRRTNARIDIPAKFDAIFVLHKHGIKNYFLNCRIHDISAGGIKIGIPAGDPELKVGDIVFGTVRLGARRPREFNLEVRYANKVVAGSRTNQTAGLQFQGVDITMENRLLSLMMDLQREFFVKYS